MGPFNFLFMFLKIGKDQCNFWKQQYCGEIRAGTWFGVFVGMAFLNICHGNSCDKKVLLFLKKGVFVSLWSLTLALWCCFFAFVFRSLFLAPVVEFFLGVGALHGLLKVARCLGNQNVVSQPGSCSEATEVLGGGERGGQTGSGGRLRVSIRNKNPGGREQNTIRTTANGGAGERPRNLWSFPLGSFVSPIGSAFPWAADTDNDDLVNNHKNTYYNDYSYFLFLIHPFLKPDRTFSFLTGWRSWDRRRLKRLGARKGGGRRETESSDGAGGYRLRIQEERRCFLSFPPNPLLRLFWPWLEAVLLTASPPLSIRINLPGHQHCPPLKRRVPSFSSSPRLPSLFYLLFKIRKIYSNYL